MTIKCPKCDGRGYTGKIGVASNICEWCDGEGEIVTYGSFQTEPTPVDAPASTYGPGPGIRPPTKDVAD